MIRITQALLGSLGLGFGLAGAWMGFSQPAPSASPLNVMDYMPPAHAAVVDALLPEARRLDGGIRFKIDEQGDGPLIRPGDRVTALYVGRLLDGSIFNQKRSRNHSFTFRVGAQPRQIIQGWERALLHMRPGGKYTVAIPPELAYRERGRPGQVPPYASVIFEIEILKVDPGAP